MRRRLPANVPEVVGTGQERELRDGAAERDRDDGMRCFVQKRDAQEEERRRERDLRRERDQGAQQRAPPRRSRGQRRGRGGVRAHTVGSTTRLIRLGNSETRAPRTAAGARQAQS